jgi:hypothetical protein
VHDREALREWANNELAIRGDDPRCGGVVNVARGILALLRDLDAAEAGPRPEDRRAVGWALRKAERQGLVAAPEPLRSAISALPYSDEELDTRLELLVGPRGQTLGGAISLTEMTDPWRGRLLAAGMIEQDIEGEWAFTETGCTINWVLDSYASSWHVWASLVYERATGEHHARRGEPEDPRPRRAE